jgi:hypothetical protein
MPRVAACLTARAASTAKLDALLTGTGLARGFDLKFRAGLAPGGNGGPERDQHLDLGIDDWFAWHLLAPAVKTESGRKRIHRSDTVYRFRRDSRLHGRGSNHAE